MAAVHSDIKPRMTFQYCFVDGKLISDPNLEETAMSPQLINVTLGEDLAPVVEKSNVYRTFSSL